MRGSSAETTRSLFTTEAREEFAVCSLQFVGSVLILIGFFGPWVAHKTAALAVTGYELSELAKFFPEVRRGAVPVMRGLFVTPLLAGAISLAVTIHRSRITLPARLGASLVSWILVLAALPPFQAIMEPQYRMQLALVAASTVLILTTPLTRQTSETARGAGLLVLVLLGAVPALWQALLLRPLVADLYGSPIWPGWGFVTCQLGFLVLLAAGLKAAVRS